MCWSMLGLKGEENGTKKEVDCSKKTNKKKRKVNKQTNKKLN